MRKSRQFSARLCLACLTLILALPATAGAQALGLACNELATQDAKEYFLELRNQYIRDKSAVDKWEFRAAAAEYIRLAEQCYQAKFGAANSGQMIDEGGMLMGANGAFTADQSPVDKYVLWGGKWGAGTPFGPGTGSFTDLAGPQITGGTVSYSYMADAVVLDPETGSALPNVAVTSLATFAPCFLDEIEQAFGAWSAVSDILFVPVTDGGGAFDAEPTGDIRIGAHTIDGPSGVLAHAFFPPPNGTFAAGDLHFDTTEAWTCAPGAGAIGIGLVALHEVGHAIGLRHEVTDLAVMNAFYNPALTFGPLADDIIGIGEIYGGAGATETTFFGPVGIGTDIPAAGARLHIRSSSTGPVDAIFLENTTGPARLNLQNLAITNTATVNQKWTINSNGDLRFTAGTDSAEMRLDAGGNLTVQTSIKVGAQTLNVPDFVFEPDYKLRPLEEVRAFVQEHRHLPGIPSAQDVSQQGLNMTEMQIGLLQKVEELTLYVLQQQDTIAQLKATQNEELIARIKELEAGLAQMQSAVE